MRVLFIQTICLLLSPASSLYIFGTIRCLFMQPDGHDLVYLEQVFFNKTLQLQFNSTVGGYEGYTHLGKKVAVMLNESQSFVKQAQKNMHQCLEFLPLMDEWFCNADNFVGPDVRVTMLKNAGNRIPTLFVCNAYNFYPRQINVTWLRNGKRVTSGVTSTDVLPNGNWLYRIISHLEYSPGFGEDITCMVEHASFLEPRFFKWGAGPEPPSMPQKEEMVFGSLSLLAGLAFAVLGGLYFLKNR